LKVKDLKVGMILTPSVNKWTKLKGLFRLSNVPMKDPATQKIVNTISAGVCARPIYKDEKYYEYAIYMGHENSSYWFCGVKKHHLLLVGDTLARITGYDMRYIESASDDEVKNESISGS
jgi:hypothetical protein